MVQRYVLARVLLVGVALLVCAPFILCASAVVRYAPPDDASEPLPQCTTCDICRSHEEDFAVNMAAYGEGVRSGQLAEFNAYVTFICMGKRGCFAAFDALRAKYEDDSASTGRE